MKLNFEKYENGLVPAVIQDAKTNVVLMLGFMNEEAIQKSEETKKVTFFSRSKNRLWTKGEESGNFLELISIKADCDKDTLLIKANPLGPVCHKGSDTCWNEKNKSDLSFLSYLETVIKSRKEEADSSSSYVASLFSKGINKIAQKVGEEATEVIIEAKDSDKDLFINECADLLFHMMILLEVKDSNLNEVVECLRSRH